VLLAAEIVELAAICATDVCQFSVQPLSVSLYFTRWLWLHMVAWISTKAVNTFCSQ